MKRKMDNIAKKKNSLKDLARFKEKIQQWLKSKVKQAQAKGVVFGMSGGIDSSVVAVLCKETFEQNHLGVFMNVESLQEDFEDAKLVAEKFNINFASVDLTSIYNNFKLILAERFGDNAPIALANLKSRLRMCTLYYIANKENFLVVGTGNRSELLVGYFTKYGDGGVDVLPIGNLYKFQVKQLASYLGIPEKIIQKIPSAGLWHGQTDEGELGITYEKLDLALQKVFDKKKGIKVSQTIVEKIKLMNEKAKHKLSLPDIFNFKLK